MLKMFHSNLLGLSVVLAIVTYTHAYNIPTIQAFQQAQCKPSPSISLRSQFRFASRTSAPTIAHIVAKGSSSALDSPQATGLHFG
jgi:hypothetical protein